jgi:hypothetical protein
MDKRKLNGGHSTKSKGVDKRKNEYRNALEEACDVQDVKDVLVTVRDKAIKGDIVAAKLFLEYYLGKPTQTIEQKNTHVLDNFNIKELYDTETS